jgi:hypothetical protein
MKPNNLMIKISSILGVCASILPSPKEGILHCPLLRPPSRFIAFILIVGGLLTCPHSSKHHVYRSFIICFGIYFDNLLYSSLISSLSIITPTFIDQCSGFGPSSRNYPSSYSINLERSSTSPVPYILGPSSPSVPHPGILVPVVTIR